MGRSQLNEHLFQIGIKESPACSCGAASESIWHYFLTCPRYIIIRDILHLSINSASASFCLNTILFGDSDCNLEKNITIFLSVQEFIEKSKRFDVEPISLQQTSIILSLILRNLTYETYESGHNQLIFGASPTICALCQWRPPFRCLPLLRLSSSPHLTTREPVTERLRSADCHRCPCRTRRVPAQRMCCNVCPVILSFSTRGIYIGLRPPSQL